MGALIPIIQGSYKVYREELMAVYAKGASSDILRIREFIYKLFDLIEDKHGQIKINRESELVLKCIHKNGKYSG